MPKENTPADPHAQGTRPGDGADDGAATAKGDGAAPPPDDTQPPGDGERTYTQAEVTAQIADRVARAKKQARQEAKAELEKERERADMEELDRIKAEKADADARAEALQAENKRLHLRTQLAGRVVNLDDAVAVLSDDFVDDDGTVDVDRYLSAKPWLRAQSSASGASPGNPAGTKRLTRDDIANMSEAEIEDRMEEVEAVLSKPPA